MRKRSLTVQFVCNHCGKTFFAEKGRIRKYCSKECAYNSIERKNNIKQTILRKYGVENVRQNKEVKNKIEKTNLEKYGYNYGFQNEKIKNKIKETNKKKYGDESARRNEQIKNKIKETNLKKYGAISPLSNEQIRKKIKNTLLNKYKVDNIMKSPHMVRCFQEKNYNNIGVYNSSQSHIQHFNNINKSFLINNFIKNGFFLIKECCLYFNVKENFINKLKIKYNINNPNKLIYQKSQNDIILFIKSFYRQNTEINNRKIITPYELDIYLPDSNLAIEFNGLNFHSYGISKYNLLNKTTEDKYYHLKKTELCEAKGIQLLHIFENEWEDKQEIWKSMIKVKLGYAGRKINARECKVKELKNKETKKFLEKNHMQGYIPSKISIGLYLNNELVQVMTFSKPRFNKKYDWELIRECSLLNTIIRGGYGKLLKYFKENYKGSIISYANRRWSSPLNCKNGIYIKNTDPNYFYFLPKENILYSRNSFQKHKLKNKLKKFDNNLTETQNMFNNGYRKIYDCGNLVYKLN